MLRLSQITDLAIISIAAHAYQSCTAFFGIPKDFTRPYEIWKAGFTGCSYGLLSGKYIIYLKRDHQTPEQYCFSIAHEMYHRVTMKHTGMRQQPWVDEMLAFLVSLWFLQEQGYQKYADYLCDVTLACQQQLSVAQLRKYNRTQNRITMLHGNFYTEDFVIGVRRIGIELASLLKPQEICQLTKADNLLNWIATLDTSARPSVRHLLGIS